MPILVLNPSADRPHEAELIPPEPIIIGRDAGNPVRIDGETVSRRHARIDWREDGACLIEDLGSANGTALNGMAISRAEVLQDGDVLHFGEVAAVYQVAEAAAAGLPVVEPAVGETFANRYRLMASLGETPLYHNFLAGDFLHGQRQVSLKIFHPGVIAQAGGFDRAAREAVRIRAASPHPHLIGLVDFGRWRGRCHLALEWVEGQPLLDLLRHRGALTLPEAMRLSRQAAAATDHARTHDLLPPDLNPRAVLIAFDPALGDGDWKRLLDAPLGRWPGFGLKIPPCLVPAASSSLRAPSPLIALICELLGHPQSEAGASRPTRIPGLGESGNAVLIRGISGVVKNFGGDTAMVDALAKAAGVAELSAV